MEIQAGTITDDKRTVNKNFSSTIIVDANVYEPCSVLSPVFLLEYNSAIMQCNYLYCATFRRYYFITDITMDNGGRMKVTCKVDPLMSYRNNINSLTITAARNEFADSGQQVDNKIVTTPKCDLSFIKLMNTNVFNIRGATSYNYVLCIAGGSTGGESEVE